MEDDRPFDDEAPIDEGERVALQQDLIDVEVLKEVLRPKGIKGAVFYCPDCEEDHYLSWDLLAGNLKELLDAGESPVHEPAFDPDPDQYVSWDYARGFLDGYESFEQEELADVALRLAQELKERGWSPPEVAGVINSLGLEPTSSEDPPAPGDR